MHTEPENVKPEDCDEEAVRISTEGVLKEADRVGDIQSVALVAFGTGLWGVSLDASIRGTIVGAQSYFENHPDTHIDKVGVVIYAQPTPENAEYMRNVLVNDVYPTLPLRK